MSDSTAPTAPTASATTSSTAQGATKPAPDADQAHVIDEDDEFEEFEEDDWTDDKKLEATVDEAKIWEENWDDDDLSDDFSAQLREAIEKESKGGNGPQPMQTS